MGLSFTFMCSGINRHWRTMMTPAVQISYYPKTYLSTLRKTCIHCMLKRTDCIDHVWRTVLTGFRRFLLPSKVSIVTISCFQYLNTQTAGYTETSKPNWRPLPHHVTNESSPTWFTITLLAINTKLQKKDKRLSHEPSPHGSRQNCF